MSQSAFTPATARTLPLMVRQVYKRPNEFSFQRNLSVISFIVLVCKCQTSKMHTTYQTNTRIIFFLLLVLYGQKLNNIAKQLKVEA